MWRGGSRLGLSVAAPFVWRCPSNLTLTPLQLEIFPDMIVNAQRKRYTYIEATGDAIWEGVIPGFELSRVEITIVDTTDKLANTEERIAFVIRVWDPPRHLYISPTDDLDVYVAIEGRVSDDTNVEWAPNY